MDLFKQAITSMVSLLFKLLVTGMFGHGTGRPIPLRLHWVVTLCIAAACLASNAKPGNLWNVTRVSTGRGWKFDPKRSSWTHWGGSGTTESILLPFAIPETFGIIRLRFCFILGMPLYRWLYFISTVLNLPVFPPFIYNLFGCSNPRIIKLLLKS